MKYLFIGGQFDGQRSEAADNVSVYQKPANGWYAAENYTKRRMTVANGPGIAYVSFFALESMTMAEALNKLVEGYKTLTQNERST